MKTENAKLSDWIWTLQISPAEKLLCLALLRFRSNKTGLCFPSQSRLAEWTGLSRSGVQKAIRSLRQKGLLDSQTKDGTSNRYKFTEGGAHSVSRGCSLSKHEPNSNQKDDVPDADLQDKSIRRAGGKDALMWEN